jgi:amino acid permease
MNQEELHRKYRKFRLASWVFLVAGLAGTIGGLYRFFLMKSSHGTNIKTQLPQVNNGTILIVLGICFFSIGVYRLVKPGTSFRKHIASEKEFRDQYKKKN